MTLSNLLFIIILVLGAGFFSSSETSYLSLSKLKVRSMVEQRKKGAKIVEKLKSNTDRLITTILIGTNLLNSYTSAFITAIAISIFGPKSVEVAPFIVAFFLTTFGQIIPKMAAGLYPEKFALTWALPLKILEIIFFPVIRVFEALSVAVVSIVEKLIKTNDTVITEDELKTLIAVGENEGTIEKDESYMMNKLSEFNDLPVRTIMRPLNNICKINIKCTQSELINKFLQSGYSTLPVFSNEPDNIVGVVYYNHVLYNSEKVENNQPEFVKKIMEDVVFIKENASVLEVLNIFRKSENKFAVIKSVKGQTIGIITMEDIVCLVFGDIPLDD